MQSKLGSFIEAWINVVIGFTINFFANMLILPLFGFHITASQNFQMGILYTLISVARSYYIRRYFNAKIHEAALRMADKVEHKEQTLLSEIRQAFSRLALFIRSKL